MGIQNRLESDQRADWIGLVIKGQRNGNFNRKRYEEMELGKEKGKRMPAGASSGLVVLAHADDPHPLGRQPCHQIVDPLVGSGGAEKPNSH